MREVTVIAISARPSAPEVNQCCEPLSDQRSGADSNLTCYHRGHVQTVRCKATPAMTSPIPAKSAGPGTCLNTMKPITVALAGNSERSKAKLACGRRAMASWSQT
jgi:hypothetical protein